MKTYAYDELYLTSAQRILGDMYDFAVNTLKIAIDEFQKLFLQSGFAEQIEIGNPTYVAGKNGCEIAKEVMRECTGVYPKDEDVMYLDKSEEYWIGWSLAYYQWETGHPFKKIEIAFPVKEMYGLYPTLHEADPSLFVSLVDERFQAAFQDARLKRLRIYAKLTQRQLAEKSGVPLRQIQLFEQGQRDITKTQGQTLLQLSRALHCQVEDLLAD